MQSSQISKFWHRMAEEAEGRTEHIEAAARVWAWARWERQWREGRGRGGRGGSGGARIKF